MPAAKVAVTIDADLLRDLDRLVEEKTFPNRSKAVQEALAEKLLKIKRDRFEAECAKLDPAEEKRLAEEGMEIEEWPEY